MGSVEQTYPDVKALREKFGFGQWAFAKLMEVSEGTVSNWECGRTKPNKRTVARLLEYERYIDSQKKKW